MSLGNSGASRDHCRSSRRNGFHTFKLQTFRSLNQMTGDSGIPLMGPEPRKSEKAPPKRRPLGRSVCAEAYLARRRSIPALRSPAPRSASEAGSGTPVGGMDCTEEVDDAVIEDRPAAPLATMPLNTMLVPNV